MHAEAVQASGRRDRETEEGEREAGGLPCPSLAPLLLQFLLLSSPSAAEAAATNRDPASVSSACLPEPESRAARRAKIPWRIPRPSTKEETLLLLLPFRLSFSEEEQARKAARRVSLQGAAKAAVASTVSVEQGEGEEPSAPPPSPPSSSSSSLPVTPAPSSKKLECSASSSAYSATASSTIPEAESMAARESLARNRGAKEEEEEPDVVVVAALSAAALSALRAAARALPALA